MEMGGPLTQVTMKTLAEQLGVSATTVSNAYNKPDRLSEDLREQILAKAKELGYCGPSAAGRALRSGKSGICGFLFGEQVSRAIADPYAVVFLSGLCEAVEEHGASVLLVRAPKDDESDMQSLQRAPIDALVFSSGFVNHPGVELLQQRGVRIVGSQRAAEGDWVAINDTKAGRLVGKHLHRLGHRDIVVVTPDYQHTSEPEFVYSPDQEHAVLRPGTYERDRVLGLWEKMPDARIRVVSASHYSRESGRRAAAYALDVQDRPTAIVALSDVLALGVWDAARDRGLTPGRDLSIVGFDDIPDVGFLGITTVRQPIAEKGRLAGRLAMDPDYPERQITLPIELVVRSSTGPAPKLNK
jgi:DNA-binding LacI/PurR family transcriptional regulator